jgi:CubicO group peptidase (beta-lactamase class C family)
VFSDSRVNAVTGAADFAAADAIVSDFFGRGGQPAIAYGIVFGGELVHSAGFGARRLAGPAPDADTVFRIASMTKSFTASAVLLLRDAGALALDDPAASYVPELAGWTYGAADAAPITIRQLLTMTAGFPTDDPWGDRQQGLALDAFGELLAAGVSFNWAPGTRFEYSNLGYAILGRVVTAASGVPYEDFIRTRLLEPLGLSRTGYRAAEFQADGLAVGYRHGLDGWEEVPFDPYGAFAPMGGVYSTVADLATWVAGFASAFPPDGDAGDNAGAPGGTVAGAHPLRAASRRLMQLPQAVTEWRSPHRLPGGASGGPAHYGFGLFVDEFPAFGRVVSHSGGYPGFGSNMRWHPATGLGVIALGNGTYAPMSALAELVLTALLPRSASYHVALAPASPGVPGMPAAAGTPGTPGTPGTAGTAGTAGTPGTAGAPWPETLAAAAAVDRLLLAWDDATADALFAENVALDRPYRERRYVIELIRQRIGTFAADGARPAESDTPAHRRWWLTGERGTVQAQIQLSPQRPPLVQSLTLAVPPARDSALARALTTVIEWLNNSDDDAWPAALPVSAAADADLIARRLRMAAIWAGPGTAGAYRAGDGAASVAVELVGEHATIVLALAVNPTTGELRLADISL